MAHHMSPAFLLKNNQALFSIDGLWLEAAGPEPPTKKLWGV